MAEDTPVDLREIQLDLPDIQVDLQDTPVDLRDLQVDLPVIQLGDSMEVVEVVGMVDTLAEATIMGDVIMVAIVATITEGMHQEGPYLELFSVE